jgi:ATP phosphoribosyltransferase regulatory subunit HisZ
MELPGGGEALVAFMSFAVSQGFGATHPLIALADRLTETHRLRLGPLTTFYEAEIEDSEDAEKLELAWQEPTPLRDLLERLAALLESDEQCAALVRRANAEGLRGDALALLSTLTAAARSGARVRLSYAL